MPWGLFNFTITIYDADSNIVNTTDFKLDLRDEDWSQNLAKYSNPDTKIIWDESKEQWYLDGEGVSPQYITNDSTYKIWKFWNINNKPKTANFKVPVTLMNRTEGGNYDFGLLKANGTEDVISGQSVFSGMIDRIQLDMVLQRRKVNIHSNGQIFII